MLVRNYFHVIINKNTYQINKVIKVIRQILGFTQEQFAAYMNIGVRTVAYWESGKIVPKLSFDDFFSLLEYMEARSGLKPQDFIQFVQENELTLNSRIRLQKIAGRVTISLVDKKE